MAKTTEPSNLAARFWPFWLFHVRRFAWPIMAALLVTSVMGYRYGRLIRIDTNLLHLLPSGTESLARLTDLRDQSDIKGFLVASFESATPQSEQTLLDAARNTESLVASN